MSELRKDYLLDRYVIIAEQRGKRPADFAKKARVTSNNKVCFFCPGNESMTPPEISRTRRDGSWKVRSFPNKFPAVTLDSSAKGVHEVIVDTDQHGKTLGDLGVEQIQDVLEMYCSRIESLGKIKKISYVLIFKNEGEEAGASLEHTHSQLIALDRIPELVKKKIEANEAYRKRKHSCAYCDLVKKEQKEKVRVVFENKSFLVFAPFASRFPFELWFVAKKHLKSIVSLDRKGRRDLAEAMKVVLSRLEKLLNRPAYNYILQIAPFGKDFHFHIELLPRLAKWAGFELGSEIIINTISPEKAAEAVRE